MQTQTITPLSAWILATRPKTLFLSICPVLIGTGLAFQTRFNLWMFLSTLLCGVFIQIGTNIANDYFDFLKGADTSKRKGPTRVTQSQLLPLNAIKKGFIISFCFAFLFALYPIFMGGSLVFFLTCLSILLGIIYTAGPYPLAYLGLGELFVFIFFGPLAVGFCYFFQTTTFSLNAFLVGIGPGLISTAVLATNNLRDIQEDKEANKNTLAVRFGMKFAKMEYLLSIIIPLTIFLVFSHHPILTIFPLLFSLPLFKILTTYQDPKELNKLLEKTAKFLVFYTLFFCLDLFL